MDLAIVASNHDQQLQGSINTTSSILAELASSTTSPPTTVMMRRSSNLELLMWQYENNRSITTSWHHVFMALYVIVGTVAFFANGLVVLAVFRNKKVRTPRNLLIFHLAVTDLALAATIPLSAIDALSKYWPWGAKTDWLCKISRSAPTTLVFMVSFIIIVIATDRYRCIVLRNHVQMTRTGAIVMLPVSFIIASFVSIPLMIHSQIVTPDVSKISPKLSHVAFCLENWSRKDPEVSNLMHRGVYSIVVAFLQYLLPLLIVLIIYALIYRYLRQQQYPRHLRQNKTNSLLASISITHCLIWLPFSLFNIFADLWPDNQLFQNDPELMITTYCAVHLIGLLSTCTNPVLYAFFNENLRREFEFMAECLCPNVIFRSYSARSAAMQKSTPNGHGNGNGIQKLKPRRDEQQPALKKFEEDDIELDATFHNTADDEHEDSCDCFQEKNADSPPKVELEMNSINHV